LVQEKRERERERESVGEWQGRKYLIARVSTSSELQSFTKAETETWSGPFSFFILII
jgi:hypothetical protein